MILLLLCKNEIFLEFPNNISTLLPVKLLKMVILICGTFYWNVIYMQTSIR